MLRGECVDNGRCTAVAAAAHATGELAVTPPLPPPGTEMVTVAPGSLETHGAIRPSASPNPEITTHISQTNVNQIFQPLVGGGEDPRISLIVLNYQRYFAVYSRGGQHSENGSLKSSRLT